MADNNSFGSSKPNQAARLAATDPLFGSPFEFLGLENVSPSSIAKGTTESIFSAIRELTVETAGKETTQPIKKGLAPTGELRDPRRNTELEAVSIRKWFEDLDVSVKIASEHSKQTMILHEDLLMRYQGMSEPEKNALLNYQRNYKHGDRAYDLANARNKLIEQIKAAAQADQSKNILVSEGKPKIGEIKVDVDLEAQGEGGQGRGRSVMSAAVTAG